MPDTLHAPPTTRALSARDNGEGYDTQIARFFGADVPTEEQADTQIESADFGRSARSRSRDRERTGPKGLKT